MSLLENYKNSEARDQVLRWFFGPLCGRDDVTFGAGED